MKLEIFTLPFFFVFSYTISNIIIQIFRIFLEIFFYTFYTFLNKKNKHFRIPKYFNAIIKIIINITNCKKLHFLLSKTCIQIFLFLQIFYSYIAILVLQFLTPLLHYNNMYVCMYIRMYV